jgi:MoaA/NifB/PqqE/SkfB family radical SAM enzyme
MEQLDWHMLSICLQDAASLGYRQLAVSGGEPLLYPHLDKLLAQARALGMLTSITTNGMLLTPARWAQISGLLEVVAVSVDGTAGEHDAIRGQHGAFARMLANLALIRASNVPFGLIFTLTQHNVDSLEFVVQLAAQQGARSVQVHPLTLYGRAADTMADARPDALELLAALAEAARLGRQLGVAVQVDALSAAQLQNYRSHLVPQQPVTRLTAVAPVLIVQADGAVVPLTHDVNRQLWLGSLYDASLPTLAREWLKAGQGDRLAHACAQTWEQLNAPLELNAMTEPAESAALYWYDEVAAMTRSLANARPIRPIHVMQAAN